MGGVFARIEKLRLVPVVTIDDAAEARKVGEALVEGGLPCAEVTFRTDAALEAIRGLSAIEGLLVGAGTVLTPEQADAAVAAGAEFIVTPGFNPKVVGHCVERGVPIAPGTSTPTDIEAALGFGLSVVKFFPAEAFGGVRTLKALSAPYRMMRFIPTGGVSASNLRDYLALPGVIACGGSWMVKRDLISAGRFDEITRLAREAVAIAAGT